MIFSRSIQKLDQVKILDVLRVQEWNGNGKYLGLPIVIGRSKKDTFNFIKEHIWKKMNLWKGKHLSIARKYVLLKSVTQAIPTCWIKRLKIWRLWNLVLGSFGFNNFAMSNKILRMWLLYWMFLDKECWMF